MVRGIWRAPKLVIELQEQVILLPPTVGLSSMWYRKLMGLEGPSYDIFVRNGVIDGMKTTTEDC